ncbi:type I methionyl aminopeptidase [Spelaeicoccus albus]|uniref:Methionine aminopeptidase n=1 Tax=Spelaeicoccus albus TaxID=1280376 RepID=A0A7Z0IJA1_9MICO|nr:type I methionyl aminopeptidase [Spelaeicoccus albus]NYI69303.1 methionyl aminopeptidase [Spelaeicoccus albus]
MFSRPKIEYKSDDDIRRMRRAGLVTAAALDAARRAIRPGATTSDVDAAAAAALADAGATSNFLGYYGYPATVCVSVNDEVVHGIPGDRVLEAGDLVSVDGGAIVDGWHGDSAFSTVIPPETSADRELADATSGALWAGIAALATARHVGEVGDAIDAYMTSRAPQLGILEDYVGHGIGTAMHQPPDVLNYSTAHRGPAVRPGMCLAIEPMIVSGSIDTRVLDDDWTVVTEDGARAAHFEHTVAVHSGGLWVLTAPDGGAEELAKHGVDAAPL